MNIGVYREPELDRRDVLIALISLGASLSVSAFAGEGGSTPADVQAALEKKVTDFLGNRKRRNSVEASIEFYSSLSRDELNQLLNRSQVDIAMRSAWEFVVRDSRPPEIGRIGVGDFSWEYVRNDGKSKAGVAQFLKVARRALGIEPPQWWERAIQTAIFHRRRPRVLEMNTKLYPEYTLDPEGWFVQRGQKLETQDSKQTLIVGKRSLAIPESVIELQKKDRNVNCLVANVTDHGAYLVCHAGCDSYIPLYCVDPDSGDVLWKATVHGRRGSPLIQLGHLPPEPIRIGACTVTMIHDAGRLLVFGADDFQAHAEGFREADGEVQFRFWTFF